MPGTTPPLVGILIGSQNDWPKVRAAAAALEEFGIAYEARVASAHRTPDLVREYASHAADRGLRVILAAAGGAAHLAGAVAAHTVLPVIGIPVPTEFAGGLDSLLSTLQMPGDVPVATVAVGGGGPRNAGLLAVQILALADPALRQKLLDFKRSVAEKAAEKDAAFQRSLPSPSGRGTQRVPGGEDAGEAALAPPPRRATSRRRSGGGDKAEPSP